MEKSILGFHSGNTLQRLATSYPDVFRVLLEYTQNALDSGSTSIAIFIDYDKRTIRILDNGEGTDKERFDQALQLVCQSRKANQKDSLGQFGIGLISALEKCEYYTFTSTPKEDPCAYRQWTFETKELLNQERELVIPTKKVENLSYLVKKSGKNMVVWRTEIFLHNITEDRTVNKVIGSELRDSIIERFGEKMRNLGTRIHIRIKGKRREPFDEEFIAPQFSGKKLEIIKYEDKGQVRTRFELFQAPKPTKGNRQGKIGIGIRYDPYRLGCSDFLQKHNLVAPEVRDLLLSGLFEGNIISSNCLLTKERTGFVENDELVNFCLDLERWYKEFGKDFHKEIADNQQEERYQTTGLKSLKKIESLLKTKQFSSLMEIVKGIKKGSIGPNHTDFEKTKGKIEETRSLSTKAEIKTKMKKVGIEELKNLKQPDVPETSGTSPSITPAAAKTSEQRGHYENLQHHTVNGSATRGSRRKIVKGQSTGLRLEYSEMSGKSVIWEFSLETGILCFNIRHPLFAQAERHERALTKFQELIMIHALNLETFPEAMRKDQRLYAEKLIEYQLYLIEAEYGYAKK